MESAPKSTALVILQAVVQAGSLRLSMAAYAQSQELHLPVIVAIRCSNTVESCNCWLRELRHEKSDYVHSWTSAKIVGLRRRRRFGGEFDPADFGGWERRRNDVADQARHHHHRRKS
jgi:hypothetical protein